MVGSARGKKRKKSSKKSRGSRKWTINIDEVLGEIIPELVERLGIDYLDLSEKELRDVVEPIVSSIVEARKTKPSTESLIKRLISGKQVLFKAISAKLMEREKLTPHQVEFIIANAPDLAGRAAPRLYREVAGSHSEYLLDSLRHLWQRYGRPTRIQCPYCGFYSVTHDLTCIVCGRSVEERDLKGAIRFNQLLVDLARRLDRQLVEEIIRAGFIAYDGEIHPPSMHQRLPHAVVLYLTRGEREMLKRLLKREES